MRNIEKKNLMENNYFKALSFLILAWISAFIFEEAPRTIIRNIPGVLHLWEESGIIWLPSFILWYGSLFLIFYLIFKEKNSLYPVIFGILYGLFFETFVFGKMANFGSFILFVLLYFGMFYFPFKIRRMILKKERMTRSEFVVVALLMFITFYFLFLMSSAA